MPQQIEPPALSDIQEIYVSLYGTRTRTSSHTLKQTRMAAKKQKKKKKNQQPVRDRIEPARYMRERARKLPIGTCYVNSDWQDSGLATVIVTRLHPDDHITAAAFLVDTFCLGVKEVVYHVNLSENDFESFLNRFKRCADMIELSYNEAHNLIYGAISFAEEGGISPCKEYNIARFILEEDTEDIPLIEYEYGKNGQHFLVMNDKQDKIHFNTLQKKLGDDFKFVENIPAEESHNDWDWDKDEVYDWDDEDDREDWEDEEEEEKWHQRHSRFDIKIMKALYKTLKKIADKKLEIQREPYSYSHPAYPKTLEIQHPLIAESLQTYRYAEILPDKVIHRILDLPADEAARDLSRIIFYEIGKTCQNVNKGALNQKAPTILIHALLLLTQLKSAEGLEALLEILRQDEQFIDIHLGDWATESMHKALYACGKDRLPILVNFLYEPGLYSFTHVQAASAMVMIAYQHPERRGEIIEEFRRLLVSMETNLPKLHACDEEFAGLLVEHLIEMKAKELIPEIKRLFASGPVYSLFWDNCEEVIEVISDENTLSDKRMEELYGVEDIFDIYDSLSM